MVDGRKTLINGKVEPWTGAVQEVFAPIYKVCLRPQTRVHQTMCCCNNMFYQTWRKSHVCASLSCFVSRAQPDSEEKILIGHQARFNEDDSLKALDAAVASWNNGRGEWAQTSPAGRIAKIEQLVAELKPKRDEIINVLMWEICKTKADATKARARTRTHLAPARESARVGLARRPERDTLCSTLTSRCRLVIHARLAGV